MNNGYIISGYEPAACFRFFEDISRIPRGSGNEKGIADFLVEFAAARGLEYYRDEENNVLIRKPATEQYKDAPAIVLQGHVDMVCEKNNDVEHDFLKDPIKLRLEGDFLMACGTTLGGDNGIAVAVMLALLDGVLPEHPEYECLFTTNEEVGLTGAYAFDYSKIHGRRMINMDSEEDGCVVVGCAGGLRSDINADVKMIELPKDHTLLSVEVKGLMGGHSGENINSGRANANKLMARLLGEVIKDTDLCLCFMEGGSKDNAIPRECRVVIAAADAEKVSEILADISEKIASELCADDGAYKLTVTAIDGGYDMCAHADATRAIINAMNVVPNGVLSMSMDVKGLVEFSRNMGVVKFNGGSLDLIFSSRSAIDSQLDYSITQLDALGEMLGLSSKDTLSCKVSHYSRYPGWKYAKVSPLRESYMRVYERLFGKSATARIIHAGLECGIISSNLPDMDIISIGPNMKDIHSPAEALDLRSCERFFVTVKEIILEK